VALLEREITAHRVRLRVSPQADPASGLASKSLAQAPQRLSGLVECDEVSAGPVLLAAEQMDPDALDPLQAVFWAHISDTPPPTDFAENLQ